MNIEELVEQCLLYVMSLSLGRTFGRGHLDHSHYYHHQSYVPIRMGRLCESVFVSIYFGTNPRIRHRDVSVAYKLIGPVESYADLNDSIEYVFGENYHSGRFLRTSFAPNKWTPLLKYRDLRVAPTVEWDGSCTWWPYWQFNREALWLLLSFNFFSHSLIRKLLVTILSILRTYLYRV